MGAKRLLESDKIEDYFETMKMLIYEMATYTDIEGESAGMLLSLIDYITYVEKNKKAVE